MRTTLALSCFSAALLALSLTATGCAALIEGGFRELDDHGSDARYESQDYWAHVADALAEEEEPAPPCHSTTIVVHHH